MSWGVGQTFRGDTASVPVTGAGTGRKLLQDTQTASFGAQQASATSEYQASSDAQTAANTQAAPAANTWQNALGTIQRSATAAFNANNAPVQQQQQVCTSP